MKTVENPKYLKKYNPKRRRPQHGLVCFVNFNDIWETTIVTAYNAKIGLFVKWDYNVEEKKLTVTEVIPIDKIKYWYVGLVDDEYIKF